MRLTGMERFTERYLSQPVTRNPLIRTFAIKDAWQKIENPLVDADKMNALDCISLIKAVTLANSKLKGQNIGQRSSTQLLQ